MNVCKNKEGNKRNQNNSTSKSSFSSPPNKRVQTGDSILLEDSGLHNSDASTQATPADNLVATEESELKAKVQDLEQDNDALKKALDKLKKEDGQRKTELKQVKEENYKLNLELGNLQCEKDKQEAKVKAEEKLIQNKEKYKNFQ